MHQNNPGFYTQWPFLEKKKKKQSRPVEQNMGAQERYTDQRRSPVDSPAIWDSKQGKFPPSVGVSAT